MENFNLGNFNYSPAHANHLTLEVDAENTINESTIVEKNQTNTYIKNSLTNIKSITVNKGFANKK